MTQEYIKSSANKIKILAAFLLATISAKGQVKDTLLMNTDSLMIEEKYSETIQQSDTLEAQYIGTVKDSSEVSSATLDSLAFVEHLRDTLPHINYSPNMFEHVDTVMGSRSYSLVDKRIVIKPLHSEPVIYDIELPLSPWILKLAAKKTTLVWEEEEDRLRIDGPFHYKGYYTLDELIDTLMTIKSGQKEIVFSEDHGIRAIRVPNIVIQSGTN